VADLRAVVFDFDGVLVNSEPLHFRALRDALRPEGIEISEEDYASTYLAYDDRETVRIALEIHHGTAPFARVEMVAERKGRLFEELMASIPLFPGARALVEDLARELPLAIASGALRREIETMLAGNGLRAAFAAVVGADDVGACKPDPEPYLAAAAALRLRVPGLEPADCVAVEDSVPGILSARAAGMRVVGVAHSFPAAALGPAHHVVPDLTALSLDRLRALVASPPARA
jgi:beta-phosphoglucomutase